MRQLCLWVSAALAAFAFATPAVASSGLAGSGVSYTWIGSSGGSGGDNHSWGDQNNWSPAGVPGDGDAVTIAPPDATHCTAHVDGVPAVTLSGLSLTQPPALCGTSITGGQLTVTGSFTWNGGTLDTPTTLAAGSVGTISGSNSRLNVLSQNLDVAGFLTLSGVTGSGASNTGALRIVNPYVLHVLGGGTLASSGANDITFLSCCVNPAKIVNDGTISVSSGDLTVDAVQLDQHGALSASGGGRLVTSSAPITAASGASYSGSGGWLIENGAKAAFTGTQTVGSGFHVELGGLAVNAGAELGGTATFTGAGALDWTGGTIEGNLTIAHGFTVRASGAHTDNGKRVLSGQDGLSGFAPSTFTNHGTMTFDQGAGVLTASAAKLVNASDGVLSLAPGTRFDTLSCCLYPSTVANHGTLIVPTGTTTNPAVLSGVAYQSDATTSIASGRELQVQSAPSSLTSATVGAGGTLTIAAPTAVSGTITVGTGTRLKLAVGGSLNGTATVAGSGSLPWVGGSLSGSLTVTATGGVPISGPDHKAIQNVGGGSTPSTVTIKSKVSIAAGTSAQLDYLDLGYSVLRLAGSTTVQNYSEIYGGTLINTGSLVINPGATGLVNRAGPVTNRGTVTVSSGTFQVGDNYHQSSGVTNLAGGAKLTNLYTSRTITIDGGVLEGTGTVNEGVLNNAGSVKPAGTGIGTLRIAGTYTQGAKATLSIDLGAKSRDRLSVGGAVIVKGRLTAHNVGTYHPALGVKYTVLTGTSLGYGITCAVTSGTGSASGHWAVSHTSTAVLLTWRSGAHRTC
jgi:hypothetical protein